MWQHQKTLTLSYMGAVTEETDTCSIMWENGTIWSVFFLFIIWLQWYSNGIFDQRDNSPWVQAVGGVRPRTQAESGQGSGRTEYSVRWASGPFFTQRSTRNRPCVTFVADNKVSDLSKCPFLWTPGVVESLHDAAYKNALCNSLYCPDHMVGNIQSEHVSIFPGFY